MQTKKVLKSIGIVFGSILLLVVGIVVYTASLSGASLKRAESFCNKVEINADLNSLENLLSTDSPDLVHVLNSDGKPVGAFKDLKKLNLAEINKSATSLLMIYKSNGPSFSACEVQFSDKKISSKKIVKHD